MALLSEISPAIDFKAHLRTYTVLNSISANMREESWFDDLEIVMLPQASTISGIPAENFREVVVRTIRNHIKILDTKVGRILKNAPETSVTIVETREAAVFCVKQFNDRGLAHRIKGVFRKPQGTRTFHNGSHLISHGIPAATPLALARKRYKGLVSIEWVIMECMVNFQELDRYLLRKFEQGWSKEELKCAVRQFGRFVGSMHSKGIFHSDLKTCNIMVSEDLMKDHAEKGSECSTSGEESVSLRFCLLDYDDVKFFGNIPMRKRVKNLAQIFLSTPSLLNKVERMRFLDEYALHAGLRGSDRKRLAQDVMRKTHGRQILYVGFTGDIIETPHPQLPK